MSHSIPYMATACPSLHNFHPYLSSDVKHVAAMDTKVKASANFAALFWQCQLHISQVGHLL